MIIPHIYHLDIPVFADAVDKEKVADSVDMDKVKEAMTSDK